MKPVCLNLSECPALGDLICATPTIRKLSRAYEQKITVVSPMPELFKKNPYVQNSYKSTSIDWDYFNEHYIVHNSFYLVGKKDERGVETKHNTIDIRQYHAIRLGFMLDSTELYCEYAPTEQNRFDIPQKYILIHPVQTWPNRTWAAENWMEIVKRLNDDGIYVISVGKDSSETGFFNVDKPVFNFDIPHGMNLMNQTSISDCYHLINNASCFITMDSGLLHLAGTTNIPIIHLGSSLNPNYRAPYRTVYGQYHKSKYVAGTCALQCCSDMKYGVKEWGSVQGVQPLIGCLENKDKFYCHPEVDQVYEEAINYIATF
jgi:ADP-heptose:LPS heptosyltransferase